jgi:hypothetical protein
MRLVPHGEFATSVNVGSTPRIGDSNYPSIILQDIVIADPKHVKSLLLPEESLSLGIFLPPLIMTSPIDLDDEGDLVAEELQNPSLSAEKRLAVLCLTFPLRERFPLDCSMASGSPLLPQRPPMSSQSRRSQPMPGAARWVRTPGS